MKGDFQNAHPLLSPSPTLAPVFFQEVADSYSEGDFIKLQALANLQETLEEDSYAEASLQAKFRLLCRSL